MKSILKRASFGAVALLAVSTGAAVADEGMLLCHIVGVDNGINNKYFANGTGEAERRYAEANGLAYNVVGMGRELVHPQSYVEMMGNIFYRAWNQAQRGREENNDKLGGAFIYDFDLTENPDGTAAGEYVRVMLSIFPEMVSCHPVQLDG